ncbi:MAG: hypothetical protein IJS19_09475, partial [Muribaculaceae bacterium]|nr:hypothetical protein [Muribaculaceae bacterium]
KDYAAASERKKKRKDSDFGSNEPFRGKADAGKSKPSRAERKNYEYAAARRARRRNNFDDFNDSFSPLRRKRRKG